MVGRTIYRRRKRRTGGKTRRKRRRGGSIATTILGALKQALPSYLLYQAVKEVVKVVVVVVKNVGVK